jgi:hypothetical protein
MLEVGRRAETLGIEAFSSIDQAPMMFSAANNLQTSGALRVCVFIRKGRLRGYDAESTEIVHLDLILRQSCLSCHHSEGMSQVPGWHGWGCAAADSSFEFLTGDLNRTSSF